MATVTVMGDNSHAGRRKHWLRKSKQELVRELLRLESEREVFGVPIGCIKTINGNKTLLWWREAPEGAEVFTVPPEPDYPEKLPCAVHLLPGLKLGKGVATKTLLEALARREKYNADMASLTLEQQADHEDAVNVIKAMMPPPALPDERTAFESFVAQKFGELVDQRRAKNGDNEYMAWDMAMAWIVWQGRSAMIQPVSQGYKLPEDNETLCHLAESHGASIAWGFEEGEYQHILTFYPYQLRAMVIDVTGGKPVTGNSPVIPDGWKLVPMVELTEKMVIHGFESEAFEALADAVQDKKGWPYSCRESAECVTGIFKAMVEVAPSPGGPDDSHAAAT